MKRNIGAYVYRVFNSGYDDLYVAISPKYSVIGSGETREEAIEDFKRAFNTLWVNQDPGLARPMPLINRCLMELYKVIQPYNVKKTIIPHPMSEQNL